MDVKRMTLTAMFAALCAVGGLLKIPLGIGSTALDAMPALISAAFLPPIFAGIAASIGHIVSAISSGFLLGPFHFLIALEMLVIVYLFAKLHRANLHRVKWLFFIVANGLLAPLPFIFLISPEFFIGAVPGILFATVINAAMAAVVMPALKKAWQRRLGELR